jgi:AraC family transcriptional regulator of adaptative response / DNA-3-methyladenine glycosylase II
MNLDAGLVSRALRLISEGALDDDGVERLADRLGVTGRHLRRLFVQHLGTTPLDVAITRRRLARRRGTASRASSTGRATARVADPECYRFRLAYRPPYDWDAVLDFLRARATPGVERVADSHYRRTIEVDGKSGAIDVSRLDATDALHVIVRVPDPRALLRIVERVRRVFDLGADPAAIAGHLRADPLLRRALARYPGIRTPGAWDGFELAVRAILGQQISVAAATTIAGRIASMFGSPVPDDRGLARLFPTATELANADIERAGVMPARAETIRTLARLVADGSIAFDSCADGKVHGRCAAGASRHRRLDRAVHRDARVR